MLPIEEEDGHREEFAALTFLAELIGEGNPVHAELDSSAVADTQADAPDAETGIEALLAASEVADDAFFDMETLFFEMHAEIDIIGHIATSDRQVSPEVRRRIEDHLALATLEDTWTLAQERRRALRDAFKVEQAKRTLLERTRNIDAQPGSPADIEDAEALWSFMQNISRMD